ncbi:MAG TPA: IPT/TIG domain-containing protein [Bryobacteraceae bacterium]|nr:IPT/TIG domain-containing protein [Bryobacteraceae bacterium]
MYGNTRRYGAQYRPFVTRGAGEITSLTGYGIGLQAGVWYQPTAQGTVPTQVGGVQVLLNHQPAPVLYAQSNQVNAIVPTDANGTVSIALTCNGRQIGSTSARVVFGVPGLFRAQAGYSTQVLALHEDFTPSSASNPAPSGFWVMLPGTGFGPTDPACTAGGLAKRSPMPGGRRRAPSGDIGTLVASRIAAPINRLSAARVEPMPKANEIQDS